jgi:hypothetical protein
MVLFATAIGYHYMGPESYYYLALGKPIVLLGKTIFQFPITFSKETHYEY